MYKNTLLLVLLIELIILNFAGKGKGLYSTLKMEIIKTVQILIL
ncbi:hypothetical protein Palpr_0256 [Paludibacter propionicigenes WB4]|uniref:Uncharacterized protein n=1 Tax=Paludibacter propionicigenes (strain DSM 17365 / JCM 13257 / WB4) TaxID=694427 RepID=E4T137_PALPW|nr:hypothetical protein Palpr_0256 [Paludibacter propionicigenes WB4]